MGIDGRWRPVDGECGAEWAAVDGWKPDQFWLAWSGLGYGTGKFAQLFYGPCIVCMYTGVQASTHV